MIWAGVLVSFVLGCLAGALATGYALLDLKLRADEARDHG